MALYKKVAALAYQDKVKSALRATSSNSTSNSTHTATPNGSQKRLNLHTLLHTVFFVRHFNYK